MSNRRNIQSLYNPHNKATLLDCSFTVDPNNANGFGVSSVNKSGRIATVFMHTTQTPGTTSNGQLNPNPASGLIVVTLQDNYNTYLSSFERITGQLSGSSINISTGSSLTVGAAYTITALGTTTTAQWQAVGVPTFITPAVGVVFIASATSGSGTGTVQTNVASGIDHIELIGNPNVMNNTNSGSVLGFGVGMQLIFACYLNSSLTAPTALSKISLGIYLNDSAQGV